VTKLISAVLDVLVVGLRHNCALTQGICELGDLEGSSEQGESGGAGLRRGVTALFQKM